MKTRLVADWSERLWGTRNIVVSSVRFWVNGRGTCSKPRLTHPRSTAIRHYANDNNYTLLWWLQDTARRDDGRRRCGVAGRRRSGTERRRRRRSEAVVATRRAWVFGGGAQWGGRRRVGIRIRDVINARLTNNLYALKDWLAGSNYFVVCRV